MLIELLRTGAAESPDQPVVQWPGRSVSYSECLTRAEELARGLHNRSIRRFASVVEDVGDLLALLCASSATGSEACVYPERLDEQRIEELTMTFQHPTVITNRQLNLTASHVVKLDVLRVAEGALPTGPLEFPALVLTTGTTGEQKGTRQDWARLVSSVRHPDERPGARWLLAYNISQFAGVQVLLHVLASRATLVVPPSLRPREVLGVMRELGVTHASATPTFWRMVAGLLDEETAKEFALQQITLGGEAVPSPLLADLARLFPGARISQVYAATEFGSGIAVHDGRNGLPLSVLSRGEDADIRMRIVDGELQVLSRVGMLGYHGEERDEHGWRPTGDLVEVRGDRIHFVGRSSERINVGGVKVDPLVVEELVTGVEGVALARAYGRANAVTGQVVVIDVVARPGADPVRVQERIKAECGSLPPAARPMRVRFVPELELRGNKVVRGPSTAGL